MSNPTLDIRFGAIKDWKFIAHRMDDAFEGHLYKTVWRNEAKKQNKDRQQKGYTANDATPDTIAEDWITHSIRDFAWHNTLICSMNNKDAAAMVSFPISEEGDNPSAWTTDPLVLQLGEIEKDLPDSLYVAFLAVKSTARKHGLAKTLLHRAVAKSHANNLGEVVTLIVNSANKLGIDFYKYFGFRELYRVEMNAKGAKTWEAAGTHWICMMCNPNDQGASSSASRKS